MVSLRRKVVRLLVKNEQKKSAIGGDIDFMRHYIARLFIVVSLNCYKKMQPIKKTNTSFYYTHTQKNQLHVINSYCLFMVRLNLYACLQLLSNTVSPMLTSNFKSFGKSKRRKIHFHSKILKYSYSLAQII